MIDCPICEKEMKKEKGGILSFECGDCKIRQSFILWDPANFTDLDIGWTIGNLCFRRGQEEELKRAFKLRSFQ